MSARKKSGRRSARRASPRRSRSSGSARKPNALSLLKDDHARVKAMFERFERTSAHSAKQDLADRICRELSLHAELEEDVFYPRVRESISDDDVMNEAEVEHTSAKELIAKIEAGSPSDGNFDALVSVLGEYVTHHVREEEGEMFPKVRRSDLDLAVLGEQIQRWKAEHGEGKKGALASLVGG
ncbi:MAG TPA: hemerythrin domain-containing protein [Myxococcota bacterium]|nr:hemerythrin domain-containing protein [Myxococcota bacterium]